MLLSACSPQTEITRSTPAFKDNIEFNHLFVVIDDTTYAHLFDSLAGIDEFSRNNESNVNAGDESWSGKYLFGKENYLEIFKQDGFKDAQVGDFGIAFMSTKLGTLDSLSKEWKVSQDTFSITDRVYMQNEQRQPWFQAISVPDPDSLKLDVWMMENSKQEMLGAGFTESDLSREIKFSEYVTRRRAKYLKVSPESLTYDKLMDRVTSISITVSPAELAYLQQHLLGFGFAQKGNVFSKGQFKIEYETSETDHFILNQIEFSLVKSVPAKTSVFRNVELTLRGTQGFLKFTPLR
jgi:hypothetical protein